MSLLVFIIVVIIVAVLLIIGTDYVAGAVGGDSRLWLLVKALIVIIAAFVVAQKAGVV